MKMTLANKITILRVLLVPIFLVLLYTGHNLIALVVFIVASLSDLLDGYIARNYNQISDFGKFMDPLADKILVISAMCYFVEYSRMSGLVLALICFREFAVSGLRLLAAGENVVIAAGKSGKVKTISTMLCLIFMLVINNKITDRIACTVILLTTLWSGVEYFINNKSVFKESR